MQHSAVASKIFAALKHSAIDAASYFILFFSCIPMIIIYYD